MDEPAMHCKNAWKYYRLFGKNSLTADTQSQRMRSIDTCIAFARTLSKNAYS